MNAFLQHIRTRWQEQRAEVRRLGLYVRWTFTWIQGCVFMAWILWRVGSGPGRVTLWWNFVGMLAPWASDEAVDEAALMIDAAEKVYRARIAHYTPRDFMVWLLLVVGTLPDLARMGRFGLHAWYALAYVNVPWNPHKDRHLNEIIRALGGDPNVERQSHPRHEKALIKGDYTMARGAAMLAGLFTVLVASVWLVVPTALDNAREYAEWARACVAGWLR